MNMNRLDNLIRVDEIVCEEKCERSFFCFLLFCLLFFISLASSSLFWLNQCQCQRNFTLDFITMRKEKKPSIFNLVQKHTRLFINIYLLWSVALFFLFEHMKNVVYFIQFWLDSIIDLWPTTVTTIIRLLFQVLNYF